MCILIFLIILLLYCYVYCLVFSGVGLAFAGGMLGCAIVSSIICRCINRGKFSLSDEQKSELVKARNMDENDFQAYRKGEEKRRTMRQQKAQTDINIMQAKLAELMVTCRKYEDELEKMDVVGPEEQNLSAIETLISLIQSHRANSITEALLQYDEQKRYEHQQIMRRLKEQQEAIVAKYKAMDDFNKAMDDLAYKNRMESIERKKLDELERIRKDAEFYRRYGNP